MTTHRGIVPTSRRFLGLPSSKLGRISAVAFLMAVVLIVLDSTVLESAATIGSVEVIGAVNFLALVVALVTGGIALIRDRERSWAVWLAAGLPALVIAAEILSLLIPGD